MPGQYPDDSLLYQAAPVLDFDIPKQADEDDCSEAIAAVQNYITLFCLTRDSERIQEFLKQRFDKDSLDSLTPDEYRRMAKAMHKSWDSQAVEFKTLYGQLMAIFDKLGLSMSTPFIADFLVKNRVQQTGLTLDHLVKLAAAVAPEVQP